MKRFTLCLLLIVALALPLSAQVEMLVNPEFECPPHGPGSTSYFYQYADFWVYWCGVSGTTGYTWLATHGGCGGSLTCSDYDLVTGCAPSINWAAGCTEYSSPPGRFIAWANTYRADCSSHACIPGDPVPTGYECYCTSDGWDSHELGSYFCCF